MTEPGCRLPRVSTVFLLFALVALVQMPASHLLRHGWLWQAVVYSQLVGVALPLLLIIWWQRYSWATLFPLTRPGIKGVIVLALATLLFAALSTVGVEVMQRLFHTPPLFEETYPQLIHIGSVWDGIGKVVLLAILPGIVEEGFFRGICQTVFARASGPVVGMVGAATLFAVAHGNLAYLHFYFALGLYLSYLRHRGDTLTWPILAHIVNNGWTIAYRNWTL